MTNKRTKRPYIVNLDSGEPSCFTARPTVATPTAAEDD